MGEPRLPTPWTSEVSPDNPLPEYPRPQLTRDAWQSLNGLWQFAAASPGETPPVGTELDERILVPFPIESALSGVGRHEDHMWYRRTFRVPPSWKIGESRRLRLHFGAVDYKARVWVNGTEVVRHTGGYGRFSADITAALAPAEEQEVIVGVEDRTNHTWQPLGKQRRAPGRGIFYTCASGIWQTVWLEPVPTAFVENLRLTPDLETSSLRLTVETGGGDGDLRAEVVAKAEGQVVGRVEGAADDWLHLPVPNPRLWSPDSPFLYDLEVSLYAGSDCLETVRSYFGMREIGIKAGPDGKGRITLNGKAHFLLSTLDQGYWPDGIYTAPTDEALAFDLEQHKGLGFNTVRKHIKVEPDRWYHHADRLGLLVWQDMPSMRLRGNAGAKAQQQFKAELHEMIEQHRNWTSIIGWVPFNEGWGEWSREETGQIADAVKTQDPTRLVDAHSGSNCKRSNGDSGRGDIVDWHEYPGPAAPPPEKHRASIDGEHGGYGLEVPGHMWFEDGSAYEMAATREELTALYEANQQEVLAAARQHGISGAVYTQITDVEHEVNGFLTYDRKVEKMDFARVRAVNESIIANADGTTLEAERPQTPLRDDQADG